MVMAQWGRPEARQDGRRLAGRPLETQVEGVGLSECETWDLDRLTSAPTRAASSSGEGVPRTTLTRVSSSIDAAYDGPGPLR